MTSEKQAIKIHPKCETKVISYFKEAMELYTSDFKLINFDIIKNFEIVYILGGMITIINEPINSESVMSIINEGIRKCKKENINDIGGITEILNNIYLNRKEKPLKQYKIVASLHIDEKVLPKKKGNFLNSSFSIYKSKTFFNKYKFQSYIKPPFEKILSGMPHFFMLEEEIEGLIKSNYIEIKLNSKDSNSAFIEGWNIIELFRSIINYSICLGDYRIIGEMNPYSILLPSANIFVFDEKNNFVSYGYTKSLYERNIKKIDKKKVKKLYHYFNDIIKKLKKIKNNKLENILFDALLRHGKGLDELAYGTSFISFWQTLELISLKHIFNFSEKNVCNRIKSILLNEKLKDKINVLYERRNYFIHEGKISDYNLMDVNNCKEISELAIYFIINHIHKFNDVNELDLFYRYINENDTNIKKIEKILKYIKKQRKK